MHACASCRCTHECVSSTALLSALSSHANSRANIQHLPCLFYRRRACFRRLHTASAITLQPHSCRASAYLLPDLAPSRAHSSSATSVSQKSVLTQLASPNAHPLLLSCSPGTLLYIHPDSLLRPRYRRGPFYVRRSLARALRATPHPSCRRSLPPALGPHLRCNAAEPLSEITLGRVPRAYIDRAVCSQFDCMRPGLVLPTLPGQSMYAMNRARGSLELRPGNIPNPPPAFASTLQRDDSPGASVPLGGASVVRTLHDWRLTCRTGCCRLPSGGFSGLVPRTDHSNVCSFVM
ncbi:hypothetical protein OH76DRAFT_1412427 [Lentinus brumalis]|uniref:Uncharacterized protein n=1 Tax=Lentinus brumalis TaxID=2498619 RepID=A0A371CLC2_9APHY|nr:hypothetical protein OH76DRAFT_1412427 [Polyporus brumalis]